MKTSRFVRRAVVALLCVGLSPSFGEAQKSEPLWDFCIKTGDYYDLDGRGYHVIYCYGEYSGHGWYYIAHGTPFIIQQY